MLSSLWRRDFSADDPFAASQSFDSGKNAINITSNASFTPITSVKYLKIYKIESFISIIVFFYYRNSHLQFLVKYPAPL